VRACGEERVARLVAVIDPLAAGAGISPLLGSAQSMRQAQAPGGFCFGGRSALPGSAGSDDLRDCGVAWLGCLSLECSDENQSNSDHSEPDPGLSAEVLA
jgi:dienelactone hydrolase